MSLHYLLDGYNLIHRIPGLTQGSLEDQRRALVRFIEIFRPQGSANNSVTIVFDGKEEVFGDPSDSAVKIIFTRNESADEKIKRMVAQASNKKNIVVVTDDRAIQYAVRAQGATVMATQEFVPKDNRPSKDRPKKPAASPGKNISKTAEFKITSEFEKIWLRDKKP